MSLERNNHFRALEDMYHKAPINEEHFPSTKLVVEKEKALLYLEVGSEYYHALGSLHGAVYFKLLDDVGYFAASSAETDYFLLTASFEIKYFRPVLKTKLRAEGRLLEVKDGVYLAQTDLFDAKDRKVASGQGKYARSKVLLKDIDTYKP